MVSLKKKKDETLLEKLKNCVLRFLNFIFYNSTLKRQISTVLARGTVELPVPSSS
jgi:hypothetical protein